jgi:lysophospholipase L1-like esterase
LNFTKFLIQGLVCLAFCTSCTSCSDDDDNVSKVNRIDVLVQNPELQYRGRWQIEGNTASASTTGSSVKIAFNGVALKANLSADNIGGDGFSYLYVIVDGNDELEQRKLIKIGNGMQVYSIVSDLEMGEHTVEIVKINESWGIVHLHNLEVYGREVTSLPAKKERLIEYYGDSNPSGWTAWDDKDQGGDDAAEGYYAYPGFTARSLNAEWVNCAIGGYGVTDGMGDKDLTDVYSKVHLYTPNADNNAWNFETNNLGKKPDVVVINLGANDYWNGATKAEIKESWHRFISSHLRTVYPQAHIVLANSIGWAIGEPADYHDEVVAELKAQGDNNVSCVKFPWLWGQDHAVISEHAGFANILSRHIAEQMGWNYTPVEHSSLPEEKGQLGNASFENSIQGIRPDGWRPINAETNARYQKSSEARDGNALVHCRAEDGVHQSILASEGDAYKLSVWAKGSGKGILNYRFRDQGQNVIAERAVELDMTSEWQQLELTSDAAPANTWQIDVVVKADKESSVDFDLMEISIVN